MAQATKSTAVRQVLLAITVKPSETAANAQKNSHIKKLRVNLEKICRGFFAAPHNLLFTDHLILSDRLKKVSKSFGAANKLATFSSQIQVIRRAARIAVRVRKVIPRLHLCLQKSQLFSNFFQIPQHV
jgi:hypothetical protein